MSSPLAQLLRQELAKYPGLDPNAVLAVSRQEGLGGGIGDQGTSFGPFQLHYGGAYPGFAPRGAQASQEWASSPQGIDYALGQINAVAHGYKGSQAIRQIVTRFERPANPDREIAGALSAYGSVPPDGGGAPAPMRPGGYAPAGMSSSGVPSQQARNIHLALSLLGFDSPAAPPAPHIAANLALPPTAPPAAPHMQPLPGGPAGHLSLAGVPQGLATRGGIELDRRVLGAAEQIARRFGVRINSGYRSPEHNAEVGGAQHSDHLTGDAVDFTGSPQAMTALYRWAQQQHFPYLEPMSQARDHVHISFIR